MSSASLINDFVIKFANINGSGSASANGLFVKAIARMGIPVSPKNIFPSNIQGLPTWFEVRVSKKGYLARREGIDIMVGVNPQSFRDDIAAVRSGGYFIYDSSKQMHDEFLREDINFIGIPMISLSMSHFANPRHQQLFKNMIYIGALIPLLNMDLEVVKQVVADKFKRKPKLIEPNYLALQLGIDNAKQNYDCPLPIQVEAMDELKGKIMIDGNTATAYGLMYGGASVAAWYPITPSTAIALSFEKFTNKYRIDPETGKKNVGIVQAEDELSAIGMVLGAGWNGARAFTATSGAGVSLMTEFIGLAYFAEIPVALINVQRGGPSTGMPTRTQQADLISCAYASQGDTKHPLLFPSTPKECFDLAAEMLDLAERLQTIVMLMSDLDLGMNDYLTEEFEWDDSRKYDRGKILSAEELDKIKNYGRYLDVDGDGICYRTLPGTHSSKGSYMTRGTSKNEYAKYTEDSPTYVRNVDRLLLKWETTKKIMPKPEFYQTENESKIGMIFFGTTTYAAIEAMERIEENNIEIDSMRLISFPFSLDVVDFVASHDIIFVIEQNRDAQMRTLLINELEVNPAKFLSILNYDGLPITADFIYTKLEQQLIDQKILES